MYPGYTPCESQKQPKSVNVEVQNCLEFNLASMYLANSCEGNVAKIELRVRRKVRRRKIGNIGPLVLGLLKEEELKVKVEEEGGEEVKLREDEFAKWTEEEDERKNKI